MGAGSKFDQPLTLIEDGHKVIACGPLQFQAFDVRAEVTIHLEQDGRGKAVTTKIFQTRTSTRRGAEHALAPKTTNG